MQKDYSNRFLAMLPFVAYTWETLTVSDTYGALWMRGDEVFRRTNSDSGVQLYVVGFVRSQALLSEVL